MVEGEITQNQSPILTLYAGMDHYDESRPLQPPCAVETNNGLGTIPPCEPGEIIQSRLRSGRSLTYLAWEHARGSTHWSPGISFTTRYRAAVDFARGKSPNGTGVVVKTEIPKDQVVSIVELSQRFSSTPGDLPWDQILGEQEYVYFGGMAGPDDEYQFVTPSRVRQLSPTLTSRLITVKDKLQTVLQKAL
jgi:hypothetical protein